jgi:hypothetical protein
MRIVDKDMLPTIKFGFWNMQFPLDGFEKSSLIRIDLFYRKTGYLAPGLGRIIPILKVLRC